MNIPKDWKLVPVEPTPEMLAATSWPGCAETDYRHMLAAAPTPPVQQDDKALTMSSPLDAAARMGELERSDEALLRQALEMLNKCALAVEGFAYHGKADKWWVALEDARALIAKRGAA